MSIIIFLKGLFMKYESKTISEVVSELNINFFLPHIQRELVWNEKQIFRLFDSLLRGYPIGTFLFWKIEEKKEEITKLEFIKDFKKKKSKNHVNTENSKPSYWLVLDGQQRLQSFYIALSGSYDNKELYFNVLSDNPTQDDDEEGGNGIVYETKFIDKKKAFFFVDEKKSKSGKRELWVKIKKFAFMDYDQLFEFATKIENEYENTLTIAQNKTAIKNINKLNKILKEDESIVYYLEKDEDYEKVLDIFIRTNSGGTKLSKSDLLFSIIKQKWKKIKAYEEFNELLDLMNSKGNFEFNTDFILKTSLVLIDKEIQYKVVNFNDINVGKIEDSWESIKESIKVVIDLIVTEFGITSKKQLRASTSLIPIIYYTYQNKIKTYQTNKLEFNESKQYMKVWLYRVLLTSLFSSQTDEILRRAREVLKVNKGQFPYAKLISALPPGKNLELKKETFEDISYEDGNDFFILSLLYPNFNLNPASPHNTPHIDHIFSQNSLESAKYKQASIHNIGNLQILTENENISKNKTEFEIWINGQSEAFLEKSYIPLDRSLWKVENYEKFLKARRDIMYSKLVERINSIKI